MKKIIQKYAVVLGFGFCLVPVAWASGQHAGGHTQHEAGSASLGEPGKREDVTRTISVTMNDSMRFTPDKIVAQEGETLLLKIHNAGQIKHELTLGSTESLQEHAQLMIKFPKMVHADPETVSLMPGENGELIWKFKQAGVVNFACLEPGHYDAGMRGSIAVEAKKAGSAAPLKEVAPAALQKSVSVTPPAVTEAGGLPWIKAKVKKVNADAAKVTLSHEEITNLDMPGMTMVFSLANKEMLNGLSEGAAIDAQFAEVDGRYVVQAWRISE